MSRVDLTTQSRKQGFIRNLLQELLRLGHGSALKRLAHRTVYVQVRKDAFQLRHIGSGKEKQVHAIEPFSTDRLLVGQFSIAQRLLKQAVGELNRARLFTCSPVVLIHPVEQAEDGLCEVEERVFYELARGAGARRVHVWVGHHLADQEALIKVSGMALYN